MNCKKCGNEMPDGARYCISCGAEHDSNGQLIVKNEPVDYNKTVMVNQVPLQSNDKPKVDYNKTVMANEQLVGKNSVDYNKTVMANDTFMNNAPVDYNKTMMANDAPDVNMPNVNNFSSNNFNANVNANVNVKKKKKGFSPVILLVVIVLILALALYIKMSSKNKNTKVQVIESETIVETTITGNVVEDFNVSIVDEYDDGEYYYKNGVKQKNQWYKDHYFGADGRKVRNSLVDNDTYYVDENGEKLKNSWYKFTKLIGRGNVNIWYYFGPDGAKLRDTYTPDGYKVDKDGIYYATDLDK